MPIGMNSLSSINTLPIILKWKFQANKSDIYNNLSQFQILTWILKNQNQHDNVQANISDIYNNFSQFQILIWILKNQNNNVLPAKKFTPSNNKLL